MFLTKNYFATFLMIDFTDFQTKIDKESPVHGSFYLTVNRVSLGLRVVV